MLADGGIEGGMGVAGGAGGAVTVVGPGSPASCRGCSCAQAVVQSVRAAARKTKTVSGWRVYWRQTSLLPGLALALLYINVRLLDPPLDQKTFIPSPTSCQYNHIQWPRLIPSPPPTAFTHPLPPPPVRPLPPSLAPSVNYQPVLASPHRRLVSAF